LLKILLFFLHFFFNLPKFAEFLLNFGQILAKFFRDLSKMQHFLKIAGKGTVKFESSKKFASSQVQI